MNYNDRVKIAQELVDRYSGRPFVWGGADCFRLAAAAIKAAGHDFRASKVQDYSTARGAIRAMRRYGAESLPDWLDGLGLVRIPPAAAWPGDIIALEGGEEGFGAALTVAIGNGRVIGFMDGVGGVLQPREYLAAWRV